LTFRLADAARPLLWDLNTTCKQLSISRRTAERLISAGRFVKATRIGRMLRYRPDDVLAWLDEQAQSRGVR
jgi:excisionase family DNA binding protein